MVTFAQIHCHIPNVMIEMRTLLERSFANAIALLRNQCDLFSFSNRPLPPGGGKAGMGVERVGVCHLKYPTPILTFPLKRGKEEWHLLKDFLHG